MPIRRKLFLIIVLAVVFALGVAATAMLVYEFRTFRPKAVEKADTQERILADLLVPPLQFNDPSTCTGYLATLGYWPGIDQVALYDARGNLFAQYQRKASAQPPIPKGPPALGAEFAPRFLLYGRAIDSGGRRLGYLWLRQELPPLYARLPQYGIMFGVVVLSLLAVALLLNFALKYVVSGPISALAGTAQSVREKKDYSLRAAPGAGDEIGNLTEAFNQMLETVQQRDISLRESRELFRSVIDNSAALIFVKDLEGRYILINRRFEDIFHVTQASVAAKTDYDLFSREIADSHRVNDNLALSSGKTVESEETAIQDDGPHTYISIKCPLRDHAGRLYAVCGLSTDITERKRVESQLRQAQKMEAIGQLAGGIAHDFNNLLTGIIGYSAMGLDMMDGNHPLHGVMRQINKSGERASALTRQLLAYSRKQVLEPKVWDVNVIVADMEEMLKPLIGESIELLKALAVRPAWVKVDRGQLEQIIMNLCVNARDAMPKGGKLMLETGLSVLHPTDAKAEREPGPHVVLSISDTGHGIPREIQGKIFEPFFTTKEVGKGTGLGLSVVYGIVKQSQGSITVYSEPGEGTVFRIYLPEAKPAGQAPPEPPATKPTHAYRGSETILLVEDEEFVRQFTRAALESRGFSVLEAGDGVAALSLLEGSSSAVDLILTDVVMPDMGGQALAAKVRSLRPAMPILFISGYSEAAIAQNGIIEKGEDFIQKPFSPHDLSKKIREVLDR